MAGVIVGLDSVAWLLVVGAIASRSVPVLLGAIASRLVPVFLGATARCECSFQTRNFVDVFL